MSEQSTLPAPERLARRDAELTGCSRAQAEQYIEGGWVRVDGAVVETPQFMVASERVELDPEARLEPADTATLLLHKRSEERREGKRGVSTGRSRWSPNH